MNIAKKCKLDRKPIILIDQDEVIVDYVGEVLNRYNARYDSSFKREDITEWKLSNILGDNVETILKDPLLFKNLTPINGAIETLKELIDSNDFDIYIVTTAHPTACKYKYEWIKKHMPFFPIENIIFTYHKHLIKGDLLLDDYEENLKNFSGKKLLFDSPHNQNNTKYEKINSWNDFKKYLYNEFF